jgi:hypothetical protein
LKLLAELQAHLRLFTANVRHHAALDRHRECFGRGSSSHLVAMPCAVRHPLIAAARRDRNTDQDDAGLASSTWGTGRASKPDFCRGRAHFWYSSLEATSIDSYNRIRVELATALGAQHGAEFTDFARPVGRDVVRILDRSRRMRHGLRW